MAMKNLIVDRKKKLSKSNSPEPGLKVLNSGLEEKELALSKEVSLHTSKIPDFKMMNKLVYGIEGLDLGEGEGEGVRPKLPASQFIIEDIVANIARMDDSRATRDAIEARKKDLEEMIVSTEMEDMAKYATEEKAAEDAARSMKERIEARKRELAEKKAMKEQGEMAAYMEEERATEETTKKMKEAIARRKRELSEAKAKKEAEEMEAYIVEEKAAEEAARALKERIEARKRELQKRKQAAMNTEKQSWSLEELRKRPEGLDKDYLETYLSDEEFEEVFGMAREHFYKLALEDQKRRKKEVGLLD